MRLSELMLVQRPREAGAYALAARSVDPKQVRALIFAQGRTGSTLLEKLICATGHFAGYGELLGQSGASVFLPVRYVEGHARFLKGRNFVCHVKLYHLTRDRERKGRKPIQPHDFLEAMTERGYHIIYLRRQNLLRHVVSNWIAEARGGFHKTDDRRESFTISVDRDRLRRALDEKRAFAGQERNAISAFPHHEIIYERDLEQVGSHQDTIDGVMRFLGLPSAPVSTDLRRINAQPLQQIVSNYDEMRRWAVEFGREEDL